MRKIPFPFLLILLMLLGLVVFPAPKAQAAESTPAPNLVISYVPEEDWNEDMMIDAQKEVAHTIYWLTGVNPPRMPHEIGLTKERAASNVGDFTIQTTVDKSFRYYTAPFVAGNGWYDVNKIVSESGSGQDSHLCFAVATANVIHWWMEQNTDYVNRYLETDPANKTAIQKYLQAPGEVKQDANTSHLYKDVILPAYTGATSGGWPDKPADFFFNGYRPDKDIQGRNSPANFPPEGPISPGGVFYDVFGKSVLTAPVGGSNFAVLNRDLPDYMRDGVGVVLGYGIGSGAHAVVVWGAEYDENNKLCALYITDNNDNDAAGAKESMIRFKAVDRNGSTLITNRVDNTGSNIIHNYYLLTLAREGWAHWFNNDHQVLYPDGQAFLHPNLTPPEPPKPDPQQPECQHEFEILSGGTKIVKHCTKCGWETGYSVDFRPYYDLTYTGKPIAPCSITPINSPSFNYGNYGYKGNRTNAGDEGYYYISVNLGGTIYRAERHFIIQPKPLDPPQKAPEAAGSDPQPYSLQVLAEHGLEYSVDKEHWFADGYITGLKPDTEYTVYVRTAAPNDSNYTHSAPSKKTLSVRTASDKNLGPAIWTITSVDGDGTVTVSNSGMRDTATLIVAGYNNEDRQTVLHVGSVTAAANQNVTVNTRSGFARYQAFLLTPDTAVPLAPTEFSPTA